MKPWAKNMALKSCNLKVLLLCIRWIIILAGFCFVLNGWIMSVEKYLSKKTSVSSTINQTSKFMFPSITFCPGVKDISYVVIKNRLMTQGKLVDEDIQAILSNLSYVRTDFLYSFSQDWQSDYKNDPFWIASIPNIIFSGKCYTYNPQKESAPGKLAQMRFKVMYPPNLNTTTDRRRWLDMGSIYLHYRDKFFFYGMQDMPSSTRISMTRLKFKQTLELSIEYSRFTALDKPEQHCISDESVSFLKCYEKQLAKQQGCQKPWFNFKEFGIRNCENETEIMSVIREDMMQPLMSAIERANMTGCLLPCTSSTYQLDYAYTDEPDTEMAGVEIYFKDFRFHYSEEYFICDMTCLIGEIGGNFGFFLGGSVLAIYDLLYFRLK